MGQKASPGDMTEVQGPGTILIHAPTNDEAIRLIDRIASVYGEVYQEPPYLEGPDDVAAFVEDWPRRVTQPGFRLVTAAADDEIVGFAFGHQLPTETKWWKGAVTPLPEELTLEHAGRTFAIIELAVRRPYRRMGIGRALHSALLSDRPEERVTLLARPEAVPAQRAYASWGYRVVGQVQPWQDAPIYDALIRQLTF